MIHISEAELLQYELDQLHAQSAREDAEHRRLIRASVLRSEQTGWWAAWHEYVAARIA